MPGGPGRGDGTPFPEGTVGRWAVALSMVERKGNGAGADWKKTNKGIAAS